MEDYFTFTPPPEAPVFRPKLDEFDDPISYINKIRPLAEKHGICRIVPPLRWRPPFSVDLNNFTFNPRVQILKELEATTRVKLLFLQELADFWRLQGTPLTLPVLDRQIVDLHALYNTVKEKSGIKNTTIEKKWNYISKIVMGRKEGASLKNIYDRLLLPYELFCLQKDKYVRSRSRSQPQKNDEAEAKAVQTNALGSLGCRTFSVKLLKFWRNRGKEVMWPIVERKTLNLYDLHVAVLKEKEEINWNRVASELGFSDKLTAEIIKHQYKNLIVPFLRFNEGVSSDLTEDNYCETCHLGYKKEEGLLFCVKCEVSYHKWCIRPPVSVSPKDSWHCYACTREEMSKPKEPYGFNQSENDYTLQEFGEMAVQFKKDHFGMPALDVPTHTIEKEYWRLLSNFDDDTVVEYGADISIQEYGMGFPTRNTEDADEYVQSKWNLNNVSVLDSSAYSYIGANIPGVTIPWMYIGMCFSTFCWHIEDHWSYSINYLHWGEPKTWYGIPGSEAERFERALKVLAPDLFSDRPDLLHDLSTTLNPNLLMDKQISVYRTDQRAGEFVITFPRAYHAGFNQGFNFAEAVNFAPANWIPIGRACIDHYASILHPAVFSHDELVCKMALRAEELDKDLAKAALQNMVAMLKAESANRKIIEMSGIENVEQLHFEALPDDSRQCHHCKTTCFLSAVSCECPNMYCIKDYDKMNSSCSCPVSMRTFKYRYDMEELLKMLKTLHSVQRM